MLLNAADFGDIASAVAAAGNGDRIYVPGYKRWAAPAGGIEITKSLEIFGDGPGDPGVRLGSVIEPAALGEDVFVVRPAAGTPQAGPVYIHDLMIAGREGGPERDGKRAIFVTGQTTDTMEYLRLERITIINMASVGIEFDLILSRQVVMSNVFASHCEDAGTRLRRADNALLTSCFWGDDVGTGLECYHTGAVVLSSNFESNRPAPKVSDGSLLFDTCPVAVVSGCRFEDPNPPPSNPVSAVFDTRRQRMTMINASHAVWAVRYTSQDVPSWVQLTVPGDRPALRTQSSAVYRRVVSEPDRIYVFGGMRAMGEGLPPALYDDTWAFEFDIDIEQGSWNQVSTGAGPSKRSGHTAVYDSQNDRMIAFGGLLEGGAATQQVWTLSGLSQGTATWTQLSPGGNAPSARYDHCAVYDPVGHRMIVFGGQSGSTVFGDVWALSLSGSPVWTQLSPAGTPAAARHSAVGVFDGVNMRIHGGKAGSVKLTDTWALGPLSGGTLSWLDISLANSEGTAADDPVGAYEPMFSRLLVLSPAGLFKPWFDGIHRWEKMLPPAPPFVKCELRNCRGGVAIMGCFSATGFGPFETTSVLIGGDCATAIVFGNRMERGQPILIALGDDYALPMGCTVWPQENPLGGQLREASIEFPPDPPAYLGSINGGLVAVPSIFRPSPEAPSNAGLQIPTVESIGGEHTLPFGQLFFVQSDSSDRGVWVYIQNVGWRMLKMA